MSFKLVEVREPPPAVAKLGDDAGRSERRGRFSYAAHARLGKLMFVCEDGGEVEKLTLPSVATIVAMSETGAVFFASDSQVFELVEGEAVAVLVVAAGEVVVRLFAAGDVVWVSHRPKVGPGVDHATPSSITRVTRDDGGWRVTHTGALPLKGDWFAGNATALLVLDDDGDLSALRCADGSGLEYLGTEGENYTGAIEDGGALAGVSHWDKGARWVLEGVEAAKPIAVKVPAEWGFEDLPATIRAGIEQQLSDGANDLVHDARFDMKDSWSLERKEKHMRAAGRGCWKAVADGVIEDFRKFYKLEVGDVLSRELEAKYVDMFEDAAGWSDYD